MSSIQTQGFGVNVMPVYHPVDPALVAFNPDAMANGVLKAFTIASEADKIQAFKMQQDELNQLRADRIAAAHATLGAQQARGLADIQVIPAQTRNTLYDLGTTAALQPGERQMKTVQQANDLGQQPSKLAMSNAQLAQDVALQPQVLGTAANEAQVKAEVAAQGVENLDTTLETNRINAEAALQKAAMDLANAPGDRERQIAVEQSKIALQQAQAAEANAMAKTNAAHAEYFLHRASLPAAIRDQSLSQIATIERNINAELNRVLPNGMSVGQYREEKLKTHIFKANGTPRDEDGEQALEMIDHLEQTKKEILDDMMTARKAMKAQAANRQTAAPVEINYTNTATGAPVAGPSIYDTPATGEAAPEIRYDAQGNAWTLDANGNVVPYKP